MLHRASLLRRGLPAKRLHQLDFQTIANRKPIFRRFFVKKGEVGLIHTPQGWALKNNSEQPIDIDFYELLRFSKFVDAV